jgi:hypothetical protein
MEYFTAIWYTFIAFRIKCHLVHFFPVLVCCTTKNLAALYTLKRDLGSRSLVLRAQRRRNRHFFLRASFFNNRGPKFCWIGLRASRGQSLKKWYLFPGARKFCSKRNFVRMISFLGRAEVSFETLLNMFECLLRKATPNAILANFLYNFLAKLPQKIA